MRIYNYDYSIYTLNMEPNTAIRKPSPSIILVEDSFVIRQVIKSVLGNEEIVQEQTIIHSSGNGLEGLGLIIVTNPNVIILDATLPKYSGRELVEFLATNPRYQGDYQRVIVTHMGNIKPDLPPQYVLIDKRDSSYLEVLISSIQDKFNGELKFNKISTRLGKFFGEKAITADCRTEKFSLKATASKFNLQRLFFLALGSISQLMSKLYLLFVYVFIGRGLDSNLPQEKKDMAKYRTQYNSVLSTFILTSFFFLIQILLVLTPGIYLYGYKFKSIASVVTRNKYQAVDFQSAVYEEGLEFNDNAYKLNSTPEYIVQRPSKEYEEEVKLQGTDRYLSIINVKGLSAEKPKVVERITHDASSPKILFNEPIEYSDLISIRENSSVNDSQTSILETTGTWTSSRVTYQLSPDGITWYYYNVNNHRWESVVSGYLNSNLVQEVNKYIDQYEAQVGGEYLYITAYLNSDGSTPLSLHSLSVERELDIVTRIKQNREKYVTTPSKELTFLNDLDEEVELSLLSAEYENGYVSIVGETNAESRGYSGEVYIYFFYYNEETGTNGSAIGRKRLEKDQEEFNYNGISLSEGAITAEAIVIEGSQASRVSYATNPVRIVSK